MAERLAGGNAAIALLANTLATVGGLYVLIEVFGPISGAHFNPAVSLVMAGARRAAATALLAPYVAAQLVGAMLGCLAGACDVRHEHPAVLGQGAQRHRAVDRRRRGDRRPAAASSCARRPARVAAMVACYIGAAYWFTASTSFANPAAAFGRMFSDSFAGIAPSSVPGFVIAELVGAGLAVIVHLLLGGSLAQAPAKPAAELEPRASVTHG